jgi:hypothetical protein
MKLYAQHGAQAGEKVIKGFQAGLLDGVIFSPRDISLGQLKSSLQEIKKDHPKADLFFDPQYYTALLANSDGVRLGNLSEDYSFYFSGRRRLELTKESNVKEDIQRTLKFQASLPVTHFLAPNILISHSLDSRETAIAIDFLSSTAGCYKKLGDRRPLFATLAISRDALMGGSPGESLTEFVDEITGIQADVKGFYLLVAAKSTESRAEIFHQDVIARWLYLNHTLSLNGYQVVNGYSDLLMPFLSAAGGAAGAAGWWSNLRIFSLNRFEASPGGGRQPTQRYLSIPLLNRISFTELDALRRLEMDVLNGLPRDSLYDPKNGSEPQRNEEVLQSWEALKKLNELVSVGSQEEKLRRCEELITRTINNYQVTGQYHQFEQKSNDEHLPALEEGLRSFKKLAEIEPATK